MTNRTKILAIFVFLLLIISTGCSWGNIFGGQDNADDTSKKAESPERKAFLVKDQELVVVYFATKDGKNLVPVTLTIKPTAEAAKVAVEKLLAGPENDFSLPTIPEGTKLKDIYLEGTTAYLDLTEEFLKTTEELAEQTVDALVLTTTEFPGVDGVQILINSQIKEKLGPIDISTPLKRRSKVNYYGNKDVKENLIKVYYSDANAIYLVPVTVQGDAKNLPLSALKKLVAGPPKNSDLSSTIWQGTKINNFKIENGVAVADFSKELLGYGGGSTAETMMINSILFTLTQFTEIERVQFLIDGEKLEYFPEGSDVSAPLSAPGKINFIQ